MPIKTLQCIANTTLFQGAPDWPAPSLLEVGDHLVNGVQGEEWIALQFEGHGLGTGIRVNNAKIRLYCHNPGAAIAGSTALQVSTAGIAGPWAESTATWNNMGGRVGTEGPYINITDRTGWLEWDVTALFREMLAGEVWYTNGFYVHPRSDTNMRKAAFRPREYADASLRPQLVIDYNIPLKILVDDIWRDVDAIKVLVGGVWRDVDGGSVLTGGQWRPMG